MLKRGMATAAAVRSTTASGSMIYESERAINEYIQFHYGNVLFILLYHLIQYFRSKRGHFAV